MSEPPQGASKALLGCLLAPVALLAVVFTLAALGLVAAVLFAGPEGPFGAQPVVGLMSVGISALLAAFFGVVAKRLIAGLRGHEVPYLMPPWVGAIVGVVFGLFALVALVMSLTGAIQSTDRNIGRTASGVVMFLAFAAVSVRSFFRDRALKKAKAAADAAA